MNWLIVGIMVGLSLALGCLAAGRHGLRARHLDIWLGAYLAQRVRRLPVKKAAERRGSIHILFCFVDHFEPITAGSTHAEERRRMAEWLTRYPALAMKHRDSDGRPVRHSWFYPGENYDPEYLDGLVRLCEQGLGEIELHLHHGHDTGATLLAKIERALADFAKHGALVTREIPSRHVYAFIHGNMALDNSMGDPSLCGVNDELRVLKETGCYADFSMPTAPCVSQTRTVNQVYYASDDPARPKSHDRGREVEVGVPPSGDLMIIPGPLAINWRSRKWGMVPRIENGEIQHSNPPTEDRVRLWVRQHTHVKGRPEWVVVKVSCHGAEDRSLDVVLGEWADRMYSFLEREYRDRPGYRLHYVTARELYNIIKAAEAGKSGNPGMFRDYLIPPYQCERRLPS